MVLSTYKSRIILNFEFVLGKRSIGSHYVGVNCRIDLGSFALFLHERSRLSTYKTSKSIQCANHPARGILTLPLLANLRCDGRQLAQLAGVHGVFNSIENTLSQLHIHWKCANIFCYPARSSSQNLFLEFELPFF